MLFQQDNTLITVNGSHKNSKDENDWKLLFNNAVPKKLKQLYEEGYEILFICYVVVN
jgi:hypothetical protein